MIFECVRSINTIESIPNDVPQLAEIRIAYINSSYDFILIGPNQSRSLIK